MRPKIKVVDLLISHRENELLPEIIKHLGFELVSALPNIHIQFKNKFDSFG